MNFFPLTSGGYIESYGEELRQDDESVLLKLTCRMVGRGRAFELVFNPVEFVKALGWDNGHVVKSESGERAPYSVYRLKACIERLPGVARVTNTMSYAGRQGSCRRRSIWTNGRCK